MNIKETAMKIKSDLSSKFDQAEEPTEEWAEDFAEALVAELAKWNEPVYQLKMGDGSWIDQAKSSYEYNSRCCNSVIRVLYTLPPTAEQIAQETAEAIAKHFEQSGIGGEYLAEAIRSGAWKEYK